MTSGAPAFTSRLRSTASFCLAAIACGVFSPAALGAASRDSAHAYEGGFTISGDRMTPDQRFTARVRVLGAKISHSGQYDMPVTFSLDVGGTRFEPFGADNSSIAGNLNDGGGARDFILPDKYEGGTAVSINATAWRRNTSNGVVTWQNYRSVNTNGSSQQVLTLRDGDLVPAIPGFLGQDSIEAMVRDYVDPVTRQVHLHEDEVIYLVELGSTDLASAAADFQDLVVLVTLAKDEACFQEADEPRNLTVTFD
jgi:hypothetical protein